MPPRKSFKKRPTKKTVKYVKKGYKRKAAYKGKRTGIRRLNVQTKGIMTTYSKDYKPSNKFGKMMQKKYWIGARNIQVSSNPFSILTSDNKQANASYGLFTASDLTLMLTIDNQQGGALGTVNNTNRLFINNCYNETLISNNNNFPVEVICYRMTAKKDTSMSPSVAWTEGLYNENASALVDLAPNYGITPLESIKLNQYYKTQKITSLTLQAGGTHKASFSIDLNRVINNEYIVESYREDPIIESLRDITTYLLWVVRGYPQQASGQPGLVQVESASVNFISTEKYSWKRIADSNTQIQYTQVLPFGTAATSSVFNIGSGANVVAAPIS